MFRFRYSFICQGTSTRRQRSGLFGLPSHAATCYYQSNHLKVEAIPLSAKDTTSYLPAIATLILLNAERQARKL